MPKATTARFDLARQCFVCLALDPALKSKATIPVCDRCEALSVVQILKLDRETQKRAASALAANILFPRVGKLLVSSAVGLFQQRIAARRRG